MSRRPLLTDTAAIPGCGKTILVRDVPRWRAGAVLECRA